MMNTGRKEQQENVNFLKSVSIFRDLSQELLEKISDLLIRVGALDEFIVKFIRDSF